ncbi:MAG: hypothetical protein ABIQ60_08690, partial [Burkholderiaceae bacterium]
DTQPSYEDRAFGGAGRDILIANTGGDRLIDWVGEFNSYLVPFAPFGMATVSRTLQPQLAEFLYALSASDGADPTRAADTGKDPQRNGEPEGELGVIRQKDVAWKAQTGAPTDPQAGNIPGGKRDVLRSANFNDGAMQALAPDSGSWTVTGGKLQVAATSLHEDAVAVYQIGDALPSYYEVQATVQVIKPTGGWKANSYIIFDYHSPTDFKFAGLDVSTNKLVMGHRDASGWIVDAQGSVQGGLKSDTWYNLLLSVNGLTATLFVDGKSTFSQTYTPTMVDGWAYGLNWGLVGFGSDNSRGVLDDIAVQVVPPANTVTKTENFAGGAGPLFTPTTADPVVGNWSASAGRYAGGLAAPADTAISLVNLGGVTQLQGDSLLDMSVLLNTSGRAGFVFDLYSDTDFKFAAIDVVTKQVMIGHRIGNNWVIDAAVSNTKALVAGTDVTLGVTLRGSSVSVTLNGQAAVGFVFNAITVDGRFGLFAKGAAASFDNLVVKTNDAAVPATLNLASGAVAPATLSVASAPDRVQVQGVLSEAIRRWAMVGDAALIAGLRGIEVEFADLAGGELAEIHEGRITLDIDAGGFGWFVDPTPTDDAEYVGIGDTLTARAGAAVGQVDLLSVLAHELGHAMGFAHSASGVMAEGLLPGQRATPERWLSADAMPAVLTSSLAVARVDRVPAPVIDWGAAFTATPTSTSSAAVDLRQDRAGATARLSKGDWQMRFVNHLGATPERMNPNAALRLHVDALPRVTANLDGLARR